MGENGTIEIVVNDRPVAVPAASANLLEALLAAGVAMPYYCWHKGLSAVGQCRVCYVNLGDPKTGAPIPRPVAACTTPLMKGMRVWTETESVKAGRNAVLEFLLAEHPLDCPVCDKAGECLLQDFTFAHRLTPSRYVERKDVRPVRDLSPELLLWPTRCIVCTRCVRFCQEVAGTGELCVAERGHQSEIETAPGRPVANLLSGNLPAVCPVGAILDREFLYRARVWLLDSAASVCPNCARGCNIWLDAVGREVRRVRARRNDAVNGPWFCNYGWRAHRALGAPDRLKASRLDGESRPTREVAAEAAVRLRNAVGAGHDPPEVAGGGRGMPRPYGGGGGAVAALAAASASLEELYLLRELVAALGGGPVGLLAAPDGEAHEFPGFRILADRNANRRGAQLVLGDAELAARAVGAILDEARAGRLSALVILGGGLPDAAYPAGLAAALGKVRATVVLDSRAGEGVKAAGAAGAAGVVLAGAAWAEKNGTFVNADGRVQRFDRAIAPPEGAVAEVELLGRMLAALAPGRKLKDAAEVFVELAQAVPELAGLTHYTLGAEGAGLP